MPANGSMTGPRAGADGVLRENTDGTCYMGTVLIGEIHQCL